ncbi:hypothetical protein MLD38_038063 [Melastoma candidum]|uniref:Uncharacterized protein n=1 Tax=Melastoma candidum TaxID=119954 RepID=A0ACB9KYV6_9MYRT|nr:hypothetical protein MLD38_038063 [Melastoma candidum]
MHAIELLLVKYARKQDGGFLKFAFVGGNSSDEHNHSFQDVMSHLGLGPGSVQHFGMNADVNSMLIMADIVLYGSSRYEHLTDIYHRCQVLFLRLSRSHGDGIFSGMK